MQPSDKYASTEVTEGGFTYRKTNSDIQTLFTLNDMIDESIAYTEALPAEFNDASMIGWRDNSSAAYISKSLVWSWNYKSSSSQQEDNRYNRLNKIEINLGASNFSGRPYIVFSTGGYGNFGYYSFGFDAMHGAIDDYQLGNKYLVTNFEVNKAVWRVSVLKGYPASDITAYLADGTEASEQDIDVNAFFANPAGYYINKFAIERCGTWNGSSWDANGPNFGPLMLWDSSVSTGLYALNVISGGNTASPQASTGYGFGNKADVSTLFNTTKDNTTNVAACNYQAFTLQREFLKGFMLGTGAYTTTIEPYENTSQLDNYCATGDTNSHALTPRIVSTAFNDRLVLIERDNYTLAKDYSSASTSHVSSYHKYITRLIKGESISKLLACCGVYFFRGNLTDLNASGATPTHMDVPAMMLGEMNEGGFTTGNWIKGEDIEEYEGPNKEGDIVHPDFNPNPPGPQPETDDNIESMTTGFVSNSGGLTKYWKMSSSDLHALLSDFNQNAPQGSSLSQNIVSLYVNAMSNSWSTGKDNIVIHAAGSQETPFTSAVEYDALLVWTHTMQLGYIDVPRVTNTFYDFSPYSTYELFIPFCGWIGLPDTVAGRRVRAEMNIDISNMSCLGIVRCETSNGDSVCIGEITGTFGAPCPIQVIESGLYRQAMANSALQIAAGVGQVAVAGATGNYGFAVGGASMALQGAVQAAGVGNTNYGSTIGRNGDSSSLGRGHDTYLKITHPVIEPVVETTTFAHSVGYMCNEVGTLSSFSGFTVCGNPHITGINATDAEKEEIKQLLESGVIL